MAKIIYSILCAKLYQFKDMINFTLPATVCNKKPTFSYLLPILETRLYTRDVKMLKVKYGNSAMKFINFSLF